MRQLGESGVWELFVPGVGVGARLQVRRPRRGRRVAREGRPDGVLGGDAPGDVEPRLRVGPRVGRRRVDARAGREAAGLAADVGLRGAPRLVAEAARGRAHLGPADRRARPVRRRPRLQPRRADAGDAASVRRIVGLPRDVVLRAGLALRRPGRLPAAGRRLPPERHRRPPRLGAGTFRDRRVGASALRRHPALRGPQPAARLAQGVGLPHLQLRPARGPELPLRERAVLARGVPHRRAARRRRRLDALPRLRATRGRVDARTSTAATRTSRRSSSSRR